MIAPLMSVRVEFSILKRICTVLGADHERTRTEETGSRRSGRLLTSLQENRKTKYIHYMALSRINI